MTLNAAPHVLGFVRSLSRPLSAGVVGDILMWRGSENDSRTILFESCSLLHRSARWLLQSLSWFCVFGGSGVGCSGTTALLSVPARAAKFLWRVPPACEFRVAARDLSLRFPSGRLQFRPPPENPWWRAIEYRDRYR